MAGYKCLDCGNDQEFWTRDVVVENTLRDANGEPVEGEYVDTIEVGALHCEQCDSDNVEWQGGLQE